MPCMHILWPEIYAQSHSDNGHVHVTAPVPAHAFAQSCPTMSLLLGRAPHGAANAFTVCIYLLFPPQLHPLLDILYQRNYTVE